MGKDKQYWSVAETISLLKLWSSFRQQLDRATRTKDTYEEIQRALAAQGHEREMEQIVNKIKKLKMEFKEMNRSELDREYWFKRNLYFDFLEKAFAIRDGGQAMESDEDSIWERSSADDLEKLRKTVQENNCLLRICSTAEEYRRLRRPKDIPADAQSHDQALTGEHEDHRKSPNPNTRRKLRSKTNLGLQNVIPGDKEESPQPFTAVTVKTESEDLSLLNSFTETGPSNSRGKWVPTTPQIKETIKTEPVENGGEAPHEQAVCSAECKIEYVVTEDDFTSSSLPPTRPVVNSEKWHDAEVQALLSLYATKKMQRDFEGQKRNTKIFEKISHDLASIDIHHTTKQCRDKIKKLKQDYKKIKEINESGTEFKKSKWYNIMDSIVGHSGGNTAATTEAPSVEPLESIFSEHNTETRASAEETVPESENNPVQLSIDPVLSSSGLKIACVVSEAADSYSMFPQLRPVPKMSNDKWLDADVKALLSLYATKEMERDSEGQTHTRIFEKISSDLASIGINHSAKNCREKIKKLKQDYRKIKGHNNQNGAEIKTSKWYDILDSLLGHLPAYSGSAGNRTDNSTELLESFCTENSTDTTDSLDHLSKSVQTQPGLEKLLGSTHVVYASGEAPRPASPTPNHSSGHVTLGSIHGENSSEARESFEDRVPEFDNNYLQLSIDPAYKTNDKWHDAEVQAFLSIYAAKKMQQDTEGQTQTKIFPGISRDLAKIGIHRTARHCREKIKKLKQDYRRIKSHNISGAQFKKSKWYNILDSILGHDPANYSGSIATPSDNSSMEMQEENNAVSTESSTYLTKPCQDQLGLDVPQGLAPAALASGSTPKPASPASYCPMVNKSTEPNCTENITAKMEGTEESVSQSEVSLGQTPHLLLHPAAACSIPCPPAVRSTAFRLRPAKRKRKESSELVECLERMHEEYLQHSRDMHEALLGRMDAHMTTVIGLMGRMVAAVEAQAAKQPRML